MSKTSKIILVTIIATCILLGLGYAAIQNITLNIAGTAVANANQNNFTVKFTGTTTVSEASKATANVTDDINATIGVTGLTEKGQSVTATYEIENASGDLSADLGLTITNSNPEYFSIVSNVEKGSLKAGEKTIVTVTVNLVKTPITESVSSVVGIQITAVPVQPGEEGSNGPINGESQEPENTEIISFIISRNTYNAEANMTWYEWLHSEYNTEGFYWNPQVQTVLTADNIRVMSPDGEAFGSGRLIQEGEIYIIQGENPWGREIAFYIDGYEYKAQENMTWEDYVNSEYNIDDYGEPVLYMSTEGYVGLSFTRDNNLGTKIKDNSDFVYSTDKIKENNNYENYTL